MRVVPSISEMLQPLEDAIRLHLLPAITGRAALSDAERRVLALPVRDGGLGIPIPTTTAANQLESSTFITQPLVNLLPFQHNADTVSLDSISNIHSTQLRLKKETSKHHREKQQLRRSNCPQANTSCIPSEITGTCIRKGCIGMADDSSTRGTWVLSTQTGVQRCTLCPLWMGANQTTQPLLVWGTVHNNPCLQLCEGSLPLNPTRSDQGYDSPTAL